MKRGGWRGSLLPFNVRRICLEMNEVEILLGVRCLKSFRILFWSSITSIWLRLRTVLCACYLSWKLHCKVENRWIKVAQDDEKRDSHPKDNNSLFKYHRIKLIGLFMPIDLKATDCSSWKPSVIATMNHRFLQASEGASSTRSIASCAPHPQIKTTLSPAHLLLSMAFDLHFDLLLKCTSDIAL